MLDRYFFDTSAFLEVIKQQAKGEAIERLSSGLRRTQKVTSVLVAYELYRGIPLSASRRKKQVQVLELALAEFTLKPVHEAPAMMASRIHGLFSKGRIDPILAAQCVDGGYLMVTTNTQDFSRVPGIRMAML